MHHDHADSFGANSGLAGIYKLSQIASYVILYISQSNSTKDHNQQHNYQKQLKIFFPLEVLAVSVRQDKKIKRYPDWKGISETLVFSVTCYYV